MWNTTVRWLPLALRGSSGRGARRSTDPIPTDSSPYQESCVADRRQGKEDEDAIPDVLRMCLWGRCQVIEERVAEGRTHIRMYNVLVILGVRRRRGGPRAGSRRCGGSSVIGARA